MIKAKFTINKISELLILILVFIASGTIEANDDTKQLFNASQVVVINITIDSTALEWIYTWENRESDSMHIASMHFENAFISETVDEVGFRLRGNTSRDSQKKSFKISFNTFIPGRQFYGVDKLNLNGEHNDPSIIRSKLCWDVFQEIGMIASRAAHAAVYINGKYYGLYIMVEHIDDEFLESRFADAGGNLWKCLWPADLTYLGDEPENYYPYHDETRPYELKTNKDKYDYSKLARLIKIINKTPDNRLEDSLSTILVVPEFLKYLAINVLTGSWDDYWFLKNNYYLYYEPLLKIFHWIPYDYDNSFGIDWFSIDWTSVNPYVFANHEQSQGQPKGPRPLAERIMQIPRYRNLYSHFLEFYAEKIFSQASWFARIDSIKERVTPWAEADTYRTLDYDFTIPDFHNSYTAVHYSNQHVKRGIKEFVNMRLGNLSSQIEWQTSGPVIYDLDYYPKNPGPADSIYVNAAIFSPREIAEAQISFQPGDLTVVINYPLQYNPLPDTKIAEFADRWSGTIPPLGGFGTGRFQITAKDSDGRTHFYPRTDVAELSVPQIDSSGVVINEFLARNNSSNSDDNGEYDDWIEIYNPTLKAVNLSGMYLSDDPGNLTRWRFPANDVLLDSKAYLLVWCDNDLGQSGWHTNFKLDGDGEYIFLSASDGVTITDSLSFDAQQTDISYGRTPDGADIWDFMQPSPNAANPTTNIDEEIAPGTFKLNLYPNPFNNELTISYHLNKRSEVSFQIFDVTGQLIWIRKENRFSGFHKIHWQAGNFEGHEISSGIYFLRMQAGQQHFFRKIILLK